MFRLVILLCIVAYSTEIKLFRTREDLQCPSVVDCANKGKECSFGFRKENGCETCECFDPCNPMEGRPVCQVNEICKVQKSMNGQFLAECQPRSTMSTGEVDPSVASNRCKQEKVIGPCRQSLARFYFDSDNGKCLSFIYGGCKGNANNFPTKEACEIACLP